MPGVWLFVFVLWVHLHRLWPTHVRWKLELKKSFINKLNHFYDSRFTSCWKLFSNSMSCVNSLTFLFVDLLFPNIDRFRSWHFWFGVSSLASSCLFHITRFYFISFTSIYCINIFHFIVSKLIDLFHSL